MQTLKEKVRFNKGRGTQFSAGYLMGVKSYLNYPKKDLKSKRAAKKALDKFSEQARSGDEFAKGIMCGTRDAANERKKKSRLSLK